MKRILTGLSAILLVIALAGAGTLAYFSDTTAESTGNSFTTGTLNINIADKNGNWSDGAVDALLTSPANWMPGQTFTTGAVVIKNAGTGDANYLAIDWHNLQAKAGTDGQTLADHIFVTKMENCFLKTGTNLNDCTWNDEILPLSQGGKQEYAKFVGDGNATLTLHELADSYIVGTPEGDYASCPAGLKSNGEGGCVKYTTDSVYGMNIYTEPYTKPTDPAIPAGGAFAMRLTLQLDPNAGNDYQNATASLHGSFQVYQDPSQIP